MKPEQALHLATRTRVLFLILALLILAGCEANIPEPETIAIEGMRNSTRVGELLFGGQPSASAIERLAADGYRTILTARDTSEISWDERAKVEALGLNFVSIPMRMPVKEITDEQVGQFAELMENGERPMVLHCGSGSRISGLWAVWLVEHQHMKPEQALHLATRTVMKGVRVVVEKRLGLGASEK